MTKASAVSAAPGQFSAASGSFDSSDLLHASAPVLRIAKAGAATLARLAVQALEEGRTCVLVSRDRQSHARLLACATAFCPELSCTEPDPGLPVWEQRVLSLPQGLLVREEQMDWPGRLACLYALALGRPRLIVASVESLLLRYPATSFFDGQTLDIARGQTLSQEDLLGRLAAWGYGRTPMVTRAGEVARRGDIVDVFVPGLRQPLRLEFFDDVLEDVRLFDVETQRSLHAVPAATLVPAKPWLQDGASLGHIADHLEDLVRSKKVSTDVAYDCHKALEQGGRTLLPGSILADTSLLEDWLPQNTLFVCEDEEKTAATFQDVHAELAERLEGPKAQVLQSARLALRDPLDLPWKQALALEAAGEVSTGALEKPVPRKSGKTGKTVGRTANKGTEPASCQLLCSAGLVVGVEPRGLVLLEHSLRSFEEVFSDPGAQDRPWYHVSTKIRAWLSEKRQVVLCFSSQRQRALFVKLAGQEGLTVRERYQAKDKGLFALAAPLQGGADLVWDGIVLLGQNVFLPRADKSARTKVRAFQGLDSFDDLQEGELLVHRDYGIGRFCGLKSLATQGMTHDFLLLEYQGEDKLYVPVDRLDIVQRYRSGDGTEPRLNRLGSVTWGTTRERARKAVEKIAADLIEMYAYRKVAKGFHYDAPDELYEEFRASFGFEETPDQARAIEDVLLDMSRDVPMDRLVCGDVGFGKTEVAMRAAFLAASNSRQVALLCPTTVLAEQHYQTFKARMKGFPIHIGLLSRFVSAREQKKTLAAAAEGEVDILIGTHRLLSKDVELPRLGLLILDEEQRFGVRHKERLKEMRKNVDVLTLSATPIPRTLQLSMSGIRDLSLIETPPRERKPVATSILERNEDTLRDVLQREMAREGQVFWVYNRIEGLPSVANYVKRLVPDARVAMVHGRMPEEEVDENMRKFWHGELDVLVCTSIIESGLDFPRANTLVVDQAQNFGLGQLYQLRGRVGRSDRQAFAYFVVPDPSHMTKIAEERLAILQDMDFLGAGFKVAMEDLRMRGAGNILGEAQTGQMARIGLDLYLEMLEQAVDRLRGTVREKETETEINIGVSARIPESYIADEQERLRQYRALTGAATGSERERRALELRDRFGPYPEEFRTFLAILDFKQFLGSLQVEKADLMLSKVRLSWAEGQTSVDPLKIMAFLQAHPDAQLIPTTTLLVPLPKDTAYADLLEDLRRDLEKLRVTDKGDEAAGQTDAAAGSGAEEKYIVATRQAVQSEGRGEVAATLTRKERKAKKKRR